MLKDYSILKFTGTDAVDFLHGQFTTDIQQQTINTSSLTAWCNAKGQLIVTGILFKTDADLYFIIHSSLQEFVEKRLRMFVLRSDVNIENLTEDYCLNAGKNIEEKGVFSIAELNGISLLISKQEQTNSIDDNIFSLQCIQSGVPWLTKQHQEQYQPQMLNMDIINGLSYQKGCYPGQEVIARLHYRGTIKKRLFVVDSNSSITIGDEVFSANEKQGDILNVAQEGNNYVALAVCNVEISKTDNILINDSEVTISKTFHE